MSEKPPSFQAPLTAAFQHAMHHLSPASDLPVAATADLNTLRTKLAIPLSESGMDATTVIDDLVKAVDGGIIDTGGPRFFGWVIGGSLPAALAADWLTSVWDQNAGMYATSPAAAVVEEVAGAWLKGLLHLPSTASFAFVTGCQMAHVTCILAARHALLARLNAAPEPIATRTGDHGRREDRYTPGRKLKHLIRARTARCCAPGCGAQAITGEIDHTVPYPAGATCQCNLSPACQRHHHAKHAPGWKLQQTQPGIMQWTTPSGRTYTTHPTQYEE